MFIYGPKDVERLMKEITAAPIGALLTLVIAGYLLCVSLAGFFGILAGYSHGGFMGCQPDCRSRLCSITLLYRAGFRVGCWLGEEGK